MALIVETGENVPNANSYVSVADIRAYALARGVTLPADDAAVEILAIKAMDYLSTKGPWKGYRTYSDQVLDWPRSGVFYAGSILPDDEIPSQLKTAQIALAMAVQSGVNLLPTMSTRLLKRQKIGPIEREFEAGAGASGNPRVGIAEAFLSDLQAFGGSLAQRPVMRA